MQIIAATTALRRVMDGDITGVGTTRRTAGSFRSGADLPSPAIVHLGSVSGGRCDDRGSDGTAFDRHG
jgi:hypothetical protein